MTSAQQQMRLAEELLAAIRRKKYLDTNPYDLVDSTSISTNFGNKFNRNAPYITEGALDVPRGSATYTETVQFRGFERKVIARNPLSYDEEGDIVLAESSDEEGDRPEGEYYEEDPFEAINLSDLLAPLMNPADLPTHPRLSRPYLDSGLTEMIRNAEDTLHREQAKLRALKEQFEWYRGDQAFVPVGDMRTEYDDWLRETVFDGTPLASRTNGNNSHATALNASLGFSAPGDRPSTIGNSSIAGDEPIENNEPVPDGDVPMLGEPQIEATATAANTRDTDPALDNANNDAEQVNGTTQPSIENTTNGTASTNQTIAASKTSTNNLGIPDDMVIDTTANTNENSNEQQSTQRMTTRALANNNTAEEEEQAPLPVHPFFLHPAPVQIPPSRTQEDDPLGMLLSFTAKQNEIVAQWRELHEGLLQARRLRDEVLRWCKAEGHVGEMSDGEDWVDYDEWGLKPDELKKGKDEEEEVPTVEGSGRRGGRGRRGGAAGGGGGGDRG